MAPFLDVIIGGSPRAAALSLKQYNKSEKQDTIRVFGRSDRAPRRMKQSEVIQVFELIGSCPNLLRLELYSPLRRRHSNLEIPAMALACCLRSTNRCLKDLLLTRIALAGNWIDMCALVVPMLNHKSMRRLYITDTHPASGSASMVQFLQAAAINRHLDTLVINDVPWAGQALSALNHQSSRLKSIRVSGSQCLTQIEWLHFVDGIRFNGALTELRITSCPLIPGMGLAVARVLAIHPLLEEVMLEFQLLDDTVPICLALATNQVVRHLDLQVNSLGSEMKQQLVTSMFAETMARNYSLHYLVLRSQKTWLSNPNLEFWLRLNRRANRRHLMQSSRQVTASEWVDELIKNRNDISVLFYLLLLNPSLCMATGYKPKKRTRKRKRPALIVYQ